MSTIERILRELESATAIAATRAEDLGTVKEAMDRRQRALADLSGLTGAMHALSLAECEDALRRLRIVHEAAAAAEQLLVAVKRDAMAEWNQWSHIYRALGAASASKATVIDCRG